MSKSLFSKITVAFAVLFGGAVAIASAAGFTKVRPGLETGGQPDATQLREFAKDGGKVVIDLRAPAEPRGYDESALAAELGLTYVALPIAGASDLTDANASALGNALRNAQGPVLLHCKSGNRVGALLALSAARDEGATPADALELGRRAGLSSLEPAVRDRLGLPPK